jgi:hypothetical protein
MKTITALCTGLVALTLTSLTHATPWYTQDPRTLPEGGWRVEEHVLGTHIGNSLADGSEAPLPGGASGVSATVLHTRVRYGVRDDLTVFMDFPFVSKEVRGTGGQVQDKSGLGDLAGSPRCWRRAQGRTTWR